MGAFVLHYTLLTIQHQTLGHIGVYLSLPHFNLQLFLVSGDMATAKTYNFCQMDEKYSLSSKRSSFVENKCVWHSVPLYVHVKMCGVLICFRFTLHTPHHSASNFGHTPCTHTPSLPSGSCMPLCVCPLCSLFIPVPVCVPASEDCHWFPIHSGLASGLNFVSYHLFWVVILLDDLDLSAPVLMLPWFFR